MSFHSPDTTADVERRFSFHPADTVQRQTGHEGIRASCKAIAHHFDRVLPAGREKSLALTKLEEAMFWANAAIARAAD